MRVTSRWTEWALQEDDLQTGILQYKYGFSKLGSSSINMVLNLLTTTQGAKSTTTALCAEVYCDPWRPLGVKFTTTAPCAEVN